MGKYTNTVPLVVIMCGIAGSGKTTYAKRLKQRGYVRLSIDETLWSTYGAYEIDYPAEKYAEYSKTVEDTLYEQLKKLLIDKNNVVIDFSFWQKEKRTRYKSLIESLGGQWELIYLKANCEVLRKRLKERSKRYDANAAFTITEETLIRYMQGFEEPINEGELIIEQTLDDNIKL